MHLLLSYGTGVLLAAFGAHALIVGVIIALLVAAIVGLVLYVLRPDAAVRRCRRGRSCSSCC
jgi:uncharacterized membrane-anchored protein